MGKNKNRRAVWTLEMILDQYRDVEFGQILDFPNASVTRGPDGELYWLKECNLSRKAVFKNLREGAELYLDPYGEGIVRRENDPDMGDDAAVWVADRKKIEEITERLRSDIDFREIYCWLYWSFTSRRRVILMENWEVAKLLD